MVERSGFRIYAVEIVYDVSTVDNLWRGKYDRGALVLRASALTPPH